jgi:hypothetical protein
LKGLNYFSQIPDAYDASTGERPSWVIRDDRVLAVAAADSTAERGEPATLNDFKS